MINKKFIKEIFESELDIYVGDSNKLNYKTTPLLCKLSLDSGGDFDRYVKNFKKWIEEDNKMFTFKEVELFTIEYNGKTYNQWEYTTAINFAKTFIQDNNFKIEELLGCGDGVFSNTFQKNYSVLNIDGVEVWFQHRVWGLDKMREERNNNIKSSGSEKLRKGLEKLNPNIKLTYKGLSIQKKIGTFKDTQIIINESNNSNL